MAAEVIVVALENEKSKILVDSASLVYNAAMVKC